MARGKMSVGGAFFMTGAAHISNPIYTTADFVIALISVCLLVSGMMCLAFGMSDF